MADFLDRLSNATKAMIFGAGIAQLPAPYQRIVRRAVEREMAIERELIDAVALGMTVEEYREFMHKESLRYMFGGLPKWPFDESDTNE